jgi:hypothetical protein
VLRLLVEFDLMPALNALATEPRFEADHSGLQPASTSAPRTSLRAKAAADLAQLVSELGDELVRYHADRRLRLDRTSPPPATEVTLVATVPPIRPSAARPLVDGPTDSSPTLRAATTVTIRR